MKYNNIDQVLKKQMYEQGITFLEGLSSDELEQIELVYNVILPKTFTSFYSKQLPIGNGFYNWRDFSEKNISEIKNKMTNYIIEGILFDIEYNDFWIDKWGDMPKSLKDKALILETELEKAPKLLPIFKHRFMVAETFSVGIDSPIISIVQSDIIFFGHNMTEYLEIEFLENKQTLVIEYPVINFWSDLIFQ